MAHTTTIKGSNWLGAAWQWVSELGNPFDALVRAGRRQRQSDDITTCSKTSALRVVMSSLMQARTRTTSKRFATCAKQCACSWNRGFGSSCWPKTAQASALLNVSEQQQPAEYRVPAR